MKSDIKIRELMSSNPYTIKEDETMDIAYKILKEHSFHHLLVVNEDGGLRGIISQTDIDKMRVGASIFSRKKKEELDVAIFEATLVKSAMSESVITAQADGSIRFAYEVFAENRIHALPVLDQDTLIGIITPLDLLHYFFNE